MRRRLEGLFVSASKEPPQQSTTIQMDLEKILPQIENTTTFGRIARLIGYSDEFVRLRLVHHPAVVQVNNRYRVPKSVAVEFITQLFA